MQIYEYSMYVKITSQFCVLQDGATIVAASFATGGAGMIETYKNETR